MGIIAIILLVIFVLSAILLTVLILMQDEQGEGLGGLFSGGSSTPFGSRSGNVLTRLTSILGAIFLITSFGLAWVNRTPESGDVVGAARRQQTSSENRVDWWKAPKEAPAPEQGAASPAPSSGTQAAPAVQPPQGAQPATGR